MIFLFQQVIPVSILIFQAVAFSSTNPTSLLSAACLGRIFATKPIVCPSGENSFESHLPHFRFKLDLNIQGYILPAKHWHPYLNKGKRQRPKITFNDHFAGDCLVPRENSGMSSKVKSCVSNTPTCHSLPAGLPLRLLSINQNPSRQGRPQFVPLYKQLLRSHLCSTRLHWAFREAGYDRKLFWGTAK